MPNQRHSYFYPTRIEYGPGVIQELPSMIKESGRSKGLLVTDQELESAGIPEKVRNLFTDSGIELITYNEVKSNPTCENVYAGKDHTLHAKVDGVVKFEKKVGGKSYVSIEPFEA